MYRAGNLREKISIYKSVIQKTDFGEKEEWILSRNTRAEVIYNYGNRNLSNSEIQIIYNRTFKVRSYIDVGDYDRLLYKGEYYRVLNVEVLEHYQYKIITAEKIND